MPVTPKPSMYLALPLPVETPQRRDSSSDPSPRPASLGEHPRAMPPSQGKAPGPEAVGAEAMQRVQRDTSSGNGNVSAAPSGAGPGSWQSPPSHPLPPPLPPSSATTPSGFGRGAPAAGAAPYLPLSLLGGIKEKGFTGEADSARAGRGTVLPPWPTVVPFPVARHRSQGPTLPPGRGFTRKGAVAGPQLTQEADSSRPHGSGQQAGRAQQETPVIKLGGGRPASGGAHQQQREQGGQGARVPRVVRVSTRDFGALVGSSAGVPGAESSSPALTLGAVREATILPTSQQGGPVPSEESAGSYSGAVRARVAAADCLGGLKPSQQQQQREGRAEAQGISRENEARLAGMSSAELAALQQEAMERLSPEALKFFRERGAAKGLRGQVGQHGRRDEPGDAQPPAREPSSSSGVPPIKDENGSASGDWDSPVSAARVLRFDMDGGIVPMAVAMEAEMAQGRTGDPESTSFHKDTPLGRASREVAVQQVAERDVLRSEGDPGGAGYTLREAVALSRSPFPAQSGAALRLLGNVLRRASSLGMMGAGEGKDGRPTARPGTLPLEKDGGSWVVGDSETWRAVWVYAFSPEVQLVLALRLALDHTHTSVMRVALVALECLLTCRENQRLQSWREGCWMGESCPANAPVHRRSALPSADLPGEDTGRQQNGEPPFPLTLPATASALPSLGMGGSLSELLPGTSPPAWRWNVKPSEFVNLRALAAASASAALGRGQRGGARKDQGSAWAGVALPVSLRASLVESLETEQEAALWGEAEEEAARAGNGREGRDAAAAAAAVGSGDAGPVDGPKRTVGSDSDVAVRDACAGLIRMNLIPCLLGILLEVQAEVTELELNSEGRGAGSASALGGHGEIKSRSEAAEQDGIQAQCQALEVQLSVLRVLTGCAMHSPWAAAALALHSPFFPCLAQALAHPLPPPSPSPPPSHPSPTPNSEQAARGTQQGGSPGRQPHGVPLLKCRAEVASAALNLLKVCAQSSPLLAAHVQQSPLLHLALQHLTSLPRDQQQQPQEKVARLPVADGIGAQSVPVDVPASNERGLSIEKGLDDPSTSASKAEAADLVVHAPSARDAVLVSLRALQLWRVLASQDPTAAVRVLESYFPFLASSVGPPALQRGAHPPLLSDHCAVSSTVMMLLEVITSTREHLRSPAPQTAVLSRASLPQGALSSFLSSASEWLKPPVVGALALQLSSLLPRDSSVAVHPPAAQGAASLASAVGASLHLLAAGVLEAARKRGSDSSKSVLESTKKTEALSTIQGATGSCNSSPFSHWLDVASNIPEVFLDPSNTLAAPEHVTPPLESAGESPSLLALLLETATATVRQGSTEAVRLSVAASNCLHALVRFLSAWHLLHAQGQGRAGQGDPGHTQGDHQLSHESAVEAQGSSTGEKAARVLKLIADRLGDSLLRQCKQRMGHGTEDGGSREAEPLEASRGTLPEGAAAKNDNLGEKRGEHAASSQPVEGTTVTKDLGRMPDRGGMVLDRPGPAPGVGVGWGARGGAVWAPVALVRSVQTAALALSCSVLMVSSFGQSPMPVADETAKGTDSQSVGAGHMNLDVSPWSVLLALVPELTPGAPSGERDALFCLLQMALLALPGLGPDSEHQQLRNKLLLMAQFRTLLFLQGGSRVSLSQGLLEDSESPEALELLASAAGLGTEGAPQSRGKQGRRQEGLPSLKEEEETEGASALERETRSSFFIHVFWQRRVVDRLLRCVAGSETEGQMWGSAESEGQGGPRVSPLMGEWRGSALPLSPDWPLVPLKWRLLSTEGPSAKPEGFQGREGEVPSSLPSSEAALCSSALHLALQIQDAAAPREQLQQWQAGVPLARLWHATSYVLMGEGPDVFLDSSIQTPLLALQDSMAKSMFFGLTPVPSGRGEDPWHSSGMPSKSSAVSQSGVSALGPSTDSQQEPPLPMSLVKAMDFLFLVSPSYAQYAQSLTQHFCAVSFGAPVFGRHLSLLLHCYVPLGIRLAAWRELEEGHGLELLPALEDCPGGAPLFLGLGLGCPMEPSSSLEDPPLGGACQGDAHPGQPPQQPVPRGDPLLPVAFPVCGAGCSTASFLHALMGSAASGSLRRCRKRGSMAFDFAAFHLTRFLFRLPSTAGASIGPGDADVGSRTLEGQRGEEALQQGLLRRLLMLAASGGDSLDVAAELVGFCPEKGLGQKTEAGISLRLNPRLRTLRKIAAGDAGLLRGFRSLQTATVELHGIQVSSM